MAARLAPARPGQRDPGRPGHRHAARSRAGVGPPARRPRPPLPAEQPKGTAARLRRAQRDPHPVYLRSPAERGPAGSRDRKSTRLNSSHVEISYAVFCLKKKKKKKENIKKKKKNKIKQQEKTKKNKK